jgi:16S rRNA processing protein RimM
MLLEIGRIDRPHGLNGEVVVTLTTDRTERLAPGTVLHVGRGPLTVRSSRPHQHRWIVHFDGVGSREHADELHGQTLRAEAIEDPDALWVHHLVGAEVVTPDGQSWGRVAAVVDNPASALLELDDATLIPIVFVTDESGLPDRVVVDPPEGLLGPDLD